MVLIMHTVSGVNGSVSISRKRARLDDDDDEHSPIPEIVEGKVKATRGSRFGLCI